MGAKNTYKKKICSAAFKATFVLAVLSDESTVNKTASACV